ncbi:MAG: elongation factor family GTP-binding protein [Symbiobacteriaceae bacterium]|jgi:GTP-binding protein|nr:elongation factor family GTP-binding protein [Symbiobacteriaceae bacterium]
MKRQDLRNVAIIAHVDHGKTTLVDGLLRQSGTFRENEQVAERVMDSNDLERERGITILSKNTGIIYKGTKINIVDTPGHADFSGEVERIMTMVDGCLLIVDASEGPMAQTKFVLRKAMEAGLKPVVVINKIDRPDERISEVEDLVLELFIELGADDDQINYPVLYSSSRAGVAKYKMEDEAINLEPIFDTIINTIPCPEGDPEAPLQAMVTSLDYDEYVGRIAIARVRQGSIKAGQQVAVAKLDGAVAKFKAAQLFGFQGLKRVPMEEASIGDIIAMTGLESVNIGETITDPESPVALTPIKVDEPTLQMTFRTNDSPFVGKEGKYVTSRHLRARLFKELERNVALRVEETDSPDSYVVSGRGELHLSILIETMRREGYELAVSKPEVIFHYDEEGNKTEPLEHLTVDIPDEYMGTVMEALGNRKAEMVNMINNGMGQLRLEFIIPARGLIGFRSDFLTMTKGYGIMNHLFHGYGPYKGEIQSRLRGSLVASEAGTATTYAIHAVQERGVMFIDPQTEVYIGMVVGENSRDQDMDVNVCKTKHLTNIRNSGGEEALRLERPRSMSLEEALEQIAEDELVEVTPKSIRLRKQYLDPAIRARLAKGKVIDEKVLQRLQQGNR